MVNLLQRMNDDLEISVLKRLSLAFAFDGMDFQRDVDEHTSLSSNILFLDMWRHDRPRNPD